MRPTEPVWPVFIVISTGAGLALAAPLLTFFKYPAVNCGQRISAACMAMVGESAGALAAAVAVPPLTRWYLAVYGDPVWAACDPTRYFEAASLFVIVSGLSGALVALFLVHHRRNWRSRYGRTVGESGVG
jgi:hypothetical protein